jgi:hypothetical protein
MPLTLRRTGLSSPAYRDWLDYVIVASRKQLEGAKALLGKAQGVGEVARIGPRPADGLTAGVPQHCRLRCTNFRRKVRNAGLVFALNHETKILCIEIALKQG